MIRNIGAQQKGIALQGEAQRKNVENKSNIGTDAASQNGHIEELKQQIENGNYKIDLRSTAIRMAQELKPQI